MNKILKLITAVILVASAGTFSACKKTFDNPPGASDPNIVANTTIKELKAMHTSTGAYDIITSDIIISGVVVADDRSGNLYKQLFIQDSTGGLQILLDANSLYGTYPVGRRIFIRCKDLCISDYNNLMMLGVKASIAGTPSVEGIPSNVISRYIVGGSINNPVVAKPITSLTQLGTTMQDKYLGTLVELNGFEFLDTTSTYADTSAYKNTLNVDIKNCAGEQTIIRSSGYANFAGKRVPGGNGKILAIYTTFGTTKQFLLRSDEDLELTNPRCNIFEEYFYRLKTPDNNTDFDFPGWKNIAPNAVANYKNSLFGSTGKVVKVTAFGTNLPTDTAWLITPPIAIPAGTNPIFSFKTAYQFALGPTTLNAYISTDYNGSDTPSASTWTLLTANIPGNAATNNSSSFSTLTSSGNINLSAYIGQTVYIAFKYMGGTSPIKTTNFEIDDIQITR